MFLSEAEWRERLRQIPVHCCNCAATFHDAGLPGDIDYPLNVGICAACWRLIRRPNHSIVSENVSLREENERLREENAALHDARDRAVDSAHRFIDLLARLVDWADDGMAFDPTADFAALDEARALIRGHKSAR